MDQIIIAQNKHTTWTKQKFTFVGIVVVAMLVLWGVAKLILVVALGLPNASPANLFMLPLLAAVSMLVLKERGAMVFPVLIFSLLAIPLPALGGPGFLLKVPILVIPFILAEHLFWLLKKHPDLAATAAGALAGSIIGFFLSGTFGAEGHAAGFIIFGVNIGAVLLGMIEGAVGGLAAHGIYTKIRNSNIVRRFLRAEDLAQYEPIPFPSIWRRKIFRFIIWIALIMIGWGLFQHVLGTVLGQTTPDPVNHRIHDFTLILLWLTTLVGMAVQLRKPAENVAGLVMALIPWVGAVFVLTVAGYSGPMTNIVWTPIILVSLATIFNPNGSKIFSSFSFGHLSKSLLGLTVIMAIPLSVFIYTQIGLQAGTIEDGHPVVIEESPASPDESTPQPSFDFLRHGRNIHAGGDTNPTENIKRVIFTPAVDNEEIHRDHIKAAHFGWTAAMGILIIVAGFLASLRPRGWRFIALVAGSLPILLGLASVVYPNDSSSFGLFWGFAAIAWGIAFIVAAKFTKDA